MLIILLIALAVFSGVAHNNSKAEFTLDELASNYSNVPLAGDAQEQQTEEGQQDQEEAEQQKQEQVDEQAQLTLENPQAKKDTKKSEDEPTKMSLHLLLMKIIRMKKVKLMLRLLETHRMKMSFSQQAL